MPSCQILQQPGYAHSPAAQSQDDHVQGTTSFLTDEHGFRSLDFRGNEISFPILSKAGRFGAFSGFAGCGQVPSSISLRVLPNFSHRTAIRCVCPSAIVFPTRGMSSFPSFIETWIYVDTMVSHIPGNRLSPANKTIKNRRIDT